MRTPPESDQRPPEAAPASESEQRAHVMRERADRIRSTPREGERAEQRDRLRAGTSVSERVDRARAQRVLSSVRDTGWWNGASAQDLERARSIANAAGTPASSRAAINSQMQHVANARYGTDVRGAIRYERENPTQPPPDVAGRAELVRSL